MRIKSAGLEVEQLGMKNFSEFKNPVSLSDPLKVKTYWEVLAIGQVKKIWMGATIAKQNFQSFIPNCLIPKQMSEKNPSSFFQSVYEVVRLIPPSRVTSYGAIARFLGSAKSARMVGWAMNASFGVFPPVPAQRVVNAAGILSGKFHFGPGDEMKNLLEAEGVIVENDTVVYFSKHFWDPSELLSEI